MVMALPGNKGDSGAAGAPNTGFTELVGGCCVRKMDNFWIFLWNGEMLAIEKFNYGWGIKVDGQSMVFDELFGAIDWWDEAVKVRRPGQGGK